MRLPKYILAVLVLFASACVSPQVRQEPDNLFWPLPPETPRIKYVQSIYTEDDIGHVYSLREKLFGKSYIDAIARPYGIFARNGKVYVTDIIAMRVLVFDLHQKQLFILGSEGGIQVPSAAVADAAGTVYVADAAQSKIAVYSPAGRYEAAFSLKGIKPVALALNEGLGRLYVVDRTAHKVVVLNSHGAKLFEFGGHGAADGLFNMPLGIAVDRTGRVYVLDSGNFRVQIFDADWKFLAKMGEVGDRPGYFANPKGIAVDSEGHIYVTDAAFSNFQIFDSAGNILLFVGRFGSGPGNLYLPAGIAIDENDRIYIADQLNSRVEVFRYLKAPH